MVEETQRCIIRSGPNLRQELVTDVIADLKNTVHDLQDDNQKSRFLERP